MELYKQVFIGAFNGNWNYIIVLLLVIPITILILYSLFNKNFREKWAEPGDFFSATAFWISFLLSPFIIEGAVVAIIFVVGLPAFIIAALKNGSKF